jgi:hypothetical protein
MSDSNTSRSSLRFEIVPDLSELIEVFPANRQGLLRNIPDRRLTFATVSGCRTAIAYGFREGELLIVDLEDEDARLSRTRSCVDDEPQSAIVPVRAIVARGVAL